MKPNSNPTDFADSVIAGLKQPTKSSRRRTAKPLPPQTPDTITRTADLLLSRIKNDRRGPSAIFAEDCETYACTLRSIHRSELDAAEAMERIREFAIELGIYFVSVSRAEKRPER